MDNPTSASVEETTLNLETPLGAELSKLANQPSSKSTPLESNAERIRGSVARLSSSSIDELQGLVVELQKCRSF